jgi:hypothetical protein
VYRLALTTCVLVAIYIPLASYLVPSLSSGERGPVAFTRLQAFLPWGGPAWRATARTSVREWTGDPKLADAWILAALARYPLDPPLWLDRAELAYGVGAPADQVSALLRTAVSIMPEGHKVNWRAAMLALKVGQTEAAEGYLRRYLVAQPWQVGKVIGIGRHWISEPTALIAKLLPAGDTYLEALLVSACRWQDSLLAEAAWKRLAASHRVNSKAGVTYTEYLLRENRGARAAQVWQAVEPDYRPGAIYNGDFSRSLKHRGGLDWQLGRVEGVTLTLNEEAYVSAPASLEVQFDGEHNSDLHVPKQLLPVTPGWRYVLSGQWRGQGLTTRALPYIQVVGYPKGALLGKVEAPTGGNWGNHGGSYWPWQEFAIEFRVPDDLSVVYVALRRQPTQNFDRFIKGQILLDDLVLEARDERAERMSRVARPLGNGGWH